MARFTFAALAAAAALQYTATLTEAAPVPTYCNNTVASRFSLYQNTLCVKQNTGGGAAYAFPQYADWVQVTAIGGGGTGSVSPLFKGDGGNGGIVTATLTVPPNSAAAAIYVAKQMLTPGDNTGCFGGSGGSASYFAFLDAQTNLLAFIVAGGGGGAGCCDNPGCTVGLAGNAGQSGGDTVYMLNGVPQIAGGGGVGTSTANGTGGIANAPSASAAVNGGPGTLLDYGMGKGGVSAHIDDAPHGGYGGDGYLGGGGGASFRMASVSGYAGGGAAGGANYAGPSQYVLSGPAISTVSGAPGSTYGVGGIGFTTGNYVNSVLPREGAVYLLFGVNLPVVNSVSRVNNTITLTGTALGTASSITVCGIACNNVTVVSGTQATCVLAVEPSSSSCPVVLTNAAGASAPIGLDGSSIGNQNSAAIMGGVIGGVAGGVILLGLIAFAFANPPIVAAGAGAAGYSAVVSVGSGAGNAYPVAGRRRRSDSDEHRD